MLVSLGKRDHTFEEPLGLLGDCHRRIEHFLGVLLKITDELKGAELPPSYRTAIETSLRYFKDAAPRHTRDEEDSLFPRMRQSQDPEIQAAMKQMEQLEAEHDLADVAHAEVDALGRQWLSRNRLDAAEAGRLHELLEALQKSYAKHLDVEDRVIFPLAGRVLSEQELAQVGREMAGRRDLHPRTNVDLGGEKK